MKKTLFIWLFAFTPILPGCYTQLAVRDAEEYEDSYVQYTEEAQQPAYNYEEEYADQEKYRDSEYSESSEYYENGEDVTVINNYYYRPGYRRYLWHYSPSISVWVNDYNYGFWYDWYWYDNYYSFRVWDPFYYPYYSHNWVYWNPYYYYYPPVYNSPQTKYRTNLYAGIRNSNSGRGSSGRNSALRSGGSGRLYGDRSAISRTGVSRTTPDYTGDRGIPTRSSGVSRGTVRDGERVRGIVPRTGIDRTTSTSRERIPARESIGERTPSPSVKRSDAGSRTKTDVREQSSRTYRVNPGSSKSTSEDSRKTYRSPGYKVKETPRQTTEKEKIKSGSTYRDSPKTSSSRPKVDRPKSSSSGSRSYSTPKSSTPRSYSAPKSSSSSSSRSQSSGSSRSSSSSSGRDRSRK
ncbi:MAG: hypothetical protein K9I71_00430 [Ignavibacteriales bacterium]|nr:hypothetical protein [Ignavibacteriales bacterium]MCF8314554.1 hypothetical protein [Ignavibacteriales bacterium]MCF8436409.1 hypothetical protein [Ignavibacteriales bacterium]